MSKESKPQEGSVIRLLQSISNSSAPYAKAAGSIIKIVDFEDEAVSLSAPLPELKIPSSVQMLIDQNSIRDVDVRSPERLLQVMDQMAQAILQSSKVADTIDDQKLSECIESKRAKYRKLTMQDLDTERRFAHTETDPLVRRASLLALSDVLNDKGLPVPEFWTNYLVN